VLGHGFSVDNYGAIIGEWEMRIPADLPQVAVRIGEITAVSAPKDILSGLDDSSRLMLWPAPEQR
jgi:hypothetical protein